MPLHKLNHPAVFGIALLLCLPGWASAQPQAAASAPATQTSAPDSGMTTRCREQQRRNALTPAAFHGRWVGKRASKPLSFTLQNNADMPGSLEGKYTWQRAPIQLAGDNDGAKLNLEESSDGTAVTGIWELQLCNGRLTGQWLDANYANAQAVELRRQ